jgi:hypothetical protein
MAVRLSALRTGRTLLSRNTYFFVSGTHFWLSKPKGLVLPEGLGKLKKSLHFIGRRTRDISNQEVLGN